MTVLWKALLRIRYETWRCLHIAFGLGAIALAFGHVLAVGRFTQTGTIRWLTLGFVVVALIAAFYLRVARQFIAARRPFRLARSTEEPDGSITLELEAVGHSGAPSGRPVRLAQARRRALRAHRAPVLLRLLRRRARPAELHRQAGR